jgi:hypothetical protein
MPTRFTISHSFFGTASFTDPSVWYGGIVPTSSDDIFIRGVRTTLDNQNQVFPGPGIPGFLNVANSGLMYWPGTQSFIRVTNTAGFPPTGSFFTYTERDVEVKIDYEGISGSFHFINCKVDNSASFPWGSTSSSRMHNSPLFDKSGGNIIQGSYLQFRPGLVVLSGSATASIYRTTIENGGKIELKDSSSYFIGNYITTNDGFLNAKDYTTFYWNNPYTSSFASSSIFSPTNDINGIPSSSFIFPVATQFSQMSFEGVELRTNTTLSLSASIGDGYLSVVSASGFEQGDWIFVGQEELTSSRVDDASRFINIIPFLQRMNVFM